MNGTSLILSLGVFAMVGVTTAFIWWGANKYSDWSARKRNLVCGSLFIGGICFAIFAYSTDSRQRAITLFETKFDWKKLPEKSWRIEVEHPGITHKIYFTPDLPPLREATGEVTLEVSFGRKEEAPVFDELLVFERERESSSDSRTRRYVWESHFLEFTPDKSGTHVLSVAAPDGYPPLLFIRIEDPLKRDGKRAAGY